MSETTIKNSELKNVTREAVLGAIDECRTIGIEAFLGKYGYGPSRRFQIRHQGQSFPMKAIMGVAAGLKHSEFFSGAEHLVKHVTRLGFQVREGKRVVTALGLLQLAQASASDARETFALPDLPVEPVSFFASGTNRTGEIRGMAAVGQDLGVVAHEIVGRAPAEKELHALAGTDINVFVDSGAFSEVKFTANGPVTVDPITAERWEEIFALYDRLASSLGPQAFLVAPDKIGDQDETLRRLETYKGRLAALAAKGARILVPVQKGALTQAQFAAKVTELLAGIAWQPALPCKKSATTPAECAAFVREFCTAGRHVHLLGLGPTNRNAPAYLSAFVGSGVTVSLDACWINANVGCENDGSNGKSKRPARRYTIAQRIAKNGARRARRGRELPQEGVARARPDPLVRARVGPLHRRRRGVSYFDEAEREVDEAHQRTTTDEAFLRRLAVLEREAWTIVSLCTGDREFPDDVRQKALEIAACQTVREIAPGIPPLASMIAHASRNRYSAMIANLGKLFRELEDRRVATRFGLLSRDPLENVKRRDAHDLAGFRPYVAKKES